MNKNRAFLGIAILIFIVVITLFQKEDKSIEKSAFNKEELSSSFLEWKEFIASSGNFKVQLPVLPQHATETVPLPNSQSYIKYDMYLAQEKDGTTFMISLIQYPKESDISNVDSLLEGVMKEMLAGNNNSKLNESQKGTYHEAPALDFAIQSNEVFIKSKAFLMDRVLYVLTLIDRNVNYIEAEFKHFLDSFEIMGNKSEKIIPTNQPKSSANMPKDSDNKS